MGSRDNLRPPTSYKPEEWAEIARKGQAAQAEGRRRKRALREVLDALLSMEYTGTALDGTELAAAAQEAAKARDTVLDQYDAVAIAQIIKAQDGDTAAAAWVRDSAGDKPGETVAVQQLSAEDVQLARKVAARLDASGNNNADAGAVNSARKKKKR
nr:MAG TPA: hypothetical protein [Ackermannviridae sp. ctjwt21]